MAGAAWVTEEEGNGTSGSWGNVVRGKGWGGTSEGGGAQRELGDVAASQAHGGGGLRSKGPG